MKLFLRAPHSGLSQDKEENGRPLLPAPQGTMELLAHQFDKRSIHSLQSDALKTFQCEMIQNNKSMHSRSDVNNIPCIFFVNSFFHFLKKAI